MNSLLKMKQLHGLFFACFLSVGLLVAGCAGSPPEPKVPGQQDTVNEPSPDSPTTSPTDPVSEHPEPIQEWLDRSIRIQAGFVKKYGNELYLLAAYGERPSGGYVVEIEDVKEESERILVRVRFTPPEPGAIVTEAITYPFDLEVIEASEKPIEFEAVGDLMYLPRLVNIDEMEPIVAESHWIKLFSPEPESKISEKGIRLRGVANVFEGNVQFRVDKMSIHSRPVGNEDSLLAEGYTTASMGDWGYFEEWIEWPGMEELETGQEIVLRVFTTSAKDGSIENEIVIPLKH